MLRYNPGLDNFDYCVAKEKKSESINYDYKIFSLFQDKEQNIWVGTDKGISIFNPYREYFKSFKYQENSPLSIGKSEIISFLQTTGGDIFTGTWGGGCAVYDSNFNYKKIIFFDGPTDLNKIWCLQQVNKETLWMGCQHGYIIVYNFLSGTSKILHPAEMEISTIRCTRKDNEGNILFGLHNGRIVGWNKKMNKFFRSAATQAHQKLPTVVDILVDKEHRCWVATEAGFKLFDIGKMPYPATWLPRKENADSISGKTCQGIEQFNDSILLIGTIYGGLNFFNKNTRQFTHLGIADGLPSNNIYAIKKDTAGFIWFTTDYGLFKFNPADKKIIPYSVEPGLISSFFVSNKFYPLRDGQWLTFTLAEAISFSQ